MKRRLFGLFCFGITIMLSSCGISEKELKTSLLKDLPGLQKYLIISRINALIKENSSHKAYMLSGNEGVLFSDGVLMLTGLKGKKIDLEDVKCGTGVLVTRYYDSVRFSFRISNTTYSKITKSSSKVYSHSAVLSVHFQRSTCVKRNTRGIAIAFMLPEEYEGKSGSERFKWLNDKHIVNLPDVHYDYRQITNQPGNYEKFSYSENFNIGRRKDTGRWEVQLKTSPEHFIAAPAPWTEKNAILANPHLELESRMYVKTDHYFVHENDLASYRQLKAGFIYKNGKWHHKDTLNLEEECARFIKKLSLEKDILFSVAKINSEIRKQPFIVSSEAVENLLQAIQKNPKAEKKVVERSKKCIQNYLHVAFSLFNNKSSFPSDVVKEYEKLVKILSNKKHLFPAGFAEQCRHKYFSAIKTGGNKPQYNNTNFLPRKRKQSMSLRQTLFLYLAGKTPSYVLLAKARNHPQILPDLKLLIEYNTCANSSSELNTVFNDYYYAVRRGYTPKKSYPFLRVCYGCLGKGVVKCQSCNGSGDRRSMTFGRKKLVQYVYSSCRSCKSDGKVQCSPCNGDGVLLRRDILHNQIQRLKNNILNNIKE